MKILVIHPEDPTTDFLCDIYKEMWCTVVRTDIGDKAIREHIESHDRIIMLGHGFPGGLYGWNRFVITKDHVKLLKNKSLCGIWCHADQFFNDNKLNGIFTGMMISEPIEAEFYKVKYTPEEIDESNTKFAWGMKHTVKYWDMDYIKGCYRLESPVALYNRARIYHKR